MEEWDHWLERAGEQHAEKVAERCRGQSGNFDNHRPPLKSHGKLDFFFKLARPKRKVTAVGLRKSFLVEGRRLSSPNLDVDVDVWLVMASCKHVEEDILVTKWPGHGSD